MTRYIYKEAFGKEISRVSYDQSKFGMAVDKDNLQPGDLVFFDTMNKGKVSHVGIYIGNDEFIHASNAKDGVKNLNYHHLIINVHIKWLEGHKLVKGSISKL